MIRKKVWKKGVLFFITCMILFGVNGCRMGNDDYQFTAMDSKQLTHAEKKHVSIATGNPDKGFGSENEEKSKLEKKDTNKKRRKAEKKNTNKVKGTAEKKDKEKRKAEKKKKNAEKSTAEKQAKAQAKAQEKSEEDRKHRQKKSEKKSTSKESVTQKSSQKNTDGNSDTTGRKSEKTSNSKPDDAKQPDMFKDAAKKFGDKQGQPVGDQSEKVLETEQPEEKKAEKICTVAIDCMTIIKNSSKLKESKKSFVPSDGRILKETEVSFEDGESVYDVLYRTCREHKIHLEAKYTPAYNTYYVEGINQLYEFDCGTLSGWIYYVNGKQPNYGCSNYQVSERDVILWRYTCNAGKDLD